MTGSSFTANHTGPTFVTGGGTLQLADPSWPPFDQNPPGGLGTGPLTIKGATVDIDGVNATVGALSGDSSALITNNNNSATLTVNPSSGGSTTYAGMIVDGPFGPNSTTALTLTGNGTLYLTGTNTYSGNTTVSGNAELIVTSPLAIDANDSGTNNLLVGNGLGAFGGRTRVAIGRIAGRWRAAVPEPGTLALLAAGGARRQPSRRRVAGRAVPRSGGGLAGGVSGHSTSSRNIPRRGACRRFELDRRQRPWELQSCKQRFRRTEFIPLAC